MSFEMASDATSAVCEPANGGFQVSGTRFQVNGTEARPEAAVAVQPETLNLKPETSVGNWQRLSGLHPGAESELSCDDYERGALKLINEFKRLLRIELDADRKLRGPKPKPKPAPIDDEHDPDHPEYADDDDDGTPPPAPPPRGEGRTAAAPSNLPTSKENVPVEATNLSLSSQERGPGGEVVGLRTFLWDPLPKVLRLLGISKKKMSQITKEFTGMSAHEVMDKMKAEDVRERMDLDAAKFIAQAWAYFGMYKSWAPWQEKKDNQGRKLMPWMKLQSYEERLEKCERGIYAPSAPRAVRKEARPAWPPPGDRHTLYKMRRESRRPGEFDLATWAIQHNFPNYARFRKACLLAHGLTPQQLEMLEFRKYEKELCAESKDDFLDLEAIDRKYIEGALRIWKSHEQHEAYWDTLCAQRRLGSYINNPTLEQAKDYLEKPYR